MSSPPAHKRHRSSAFAIPSTGMSAQIPSSQLPFTDEDAAAQAASSATAANPRKRRASNNTGAAATLPISASSAAEASGAIAPPLTPETATKKKGRTNTPWTPEEEQKLQLMRGENKGWSEIAKSFPTRTEGSVKKHWYKDMHYAEFNEDEAATLRDAIRDYEANKWKIIGQKVGKPAKACEHYAREHFRSP